MKFVFSNSILKIYTKKTILNQFIFVIIAHIRNPLRSKERKQKSQGHLDVRR